MTAGRGVDVYAHANPFFVRAVRGHPGRAEVLDIGCWNGTLGREIMQECDAVVDGTGVNAGAPDQGIQDRSPEIRRMPVLQCAVTLPARGPHGVDDICVQVSPPHGCGREPSRSARHPPLLLKLIKINSRVAPSRALDS